MDVDILSRLVSDRLGNRLWVLRDPFIFSIDGDFYTIPRGFVFDGASCPRGLWSFCAPVAGPFGEAALIHDWFYSIEGPDIGRPIADLALYFFGRFRGAGFLRAHLVKKGVNIFGEPHYKTATEKMTEKTCYDLDKSLLLVGELNVDVDEIFKREIEGEFQRDTFEMENTN